MKRNRGKIIAKDNGENGQEYGEWRLRGRGKKVKFNDEEGARSKRRKWARAWQMKIFGTKMGWSHEWSWLKKSWLKNGCWSWRNLRKRETMGWPWSHLRRGTDCCAGWITISTFQLNYTCNCIHVFSFMTDFFLKSRFVRHSLQSLAANRQKNRPDTIMAVGQQSWTYRRILFWGIQIEK